jgi:hypothetical protein
MAYTLEDANRLRELMRAAPDKAPNQRRMDKQAIVAEVIDEIEAMQKRGYTLEEVAELWAKGGFEVTLPTLKSYLQRSRKTRAKGAVKAPRPSSAPRASERARIEKPGTAKAAPASSRAGNADGAPSAPKSTQSEFMTDDSPKIFGRKDGP